MRRILYFAAITAVLALGSCDKNDSAETPTTPPTPTTPTDPEKTPISFTTEIAALTRTPQLEADGSGTFSAGDTFTLYAHDNAEKHTEMTYTLGATELYWEDLGVATQDNKVHFEACYPQQTLSDGGFSFTVTQDEAGDLLWATAPGVEIGTSEPVSLRFTHAMHRLRVRFTVEDASIDASQIETRCTAIANCRVQLSIQKLLEAEIAVKETFTARGPEVTFLLPPQMPSDVTLEVQAGNMVKSWNLADTNFSLPELASGMEGVVDLTVREGTITLAGMSIDGWGDQGTVEGEIIL